VGYLPTDSTYAKVIAWLMAKNGIESFEATITELEHTEDTYDFQAFVVNGGSDEPKVEARITKKCKHENVSQMEGLMRWKCDGCGLQYRLVPAGPLG